MDESELPSWVTLSTIENGCMWNVQPEHWDEIDAAYHHWVERRIDRVLTLNRLEGGEILIAASRLSEIVMSTPATRRRLRELADLQKAESGYEDA